MRDGEAQRIAGVKWCARHINTGEGDRVPADAILIACSNFTADESLLTGESVAVRKVACLPAEGENNDDANRSLLPPAVMTIPMSIPPHCWCRAAHRAVLPRRSQRNRQDRQSPV